MSISCQFLLVINAASLAQDDKAKQCIWQGNKAVRQGHAALLCSLVEGATDGLIAGNSLKLGAWVPGCLLVPVLRAQLNSAAAAHKNTR